jgi:hypothetical protein
VIASFLLGAASTAAACGKDDGGSSAGADSGSSNVVVGSSICPSPDAAPNNGDLCLLPPGAACAFGECGSIFQCAGGVWLKAGNPAPAPACPLAEPPAKDTACPPCWPSDKPCPYETADCTSPDASARRSAKRAVATCPNGLWILAFEPCASQDAGPDADSGADVQGDAGLDAD